MSTQHSQPYSGKVNLSERTAPVLCGLVAVVTCLTFAAFTGHMWEDYFITFRASLNLATGHGLVFQTGERVHTFTSPLGTLLPALFAWGGGENVAVRSLWIFRFVSAAAFGCAIWIVGRTMLRSGLATPTVIAVGLVWALDPKTVDFSINGMETALLVLFVAITWRGFASETKILPCALGLAGLQWTRPDGCVLFSAIAVAWILSGKRTPAETRAARVGFVLRAGLIGGIFYLPWLLFAWAYYGSPIPHTILAKISPFGPGELSHALLLYPWRLLFGHVALHGVFMPAYFFFGGWPAELSWIARLVVVGAAVAWMVPGLRAAGRVASLAFFLGGFYVEYIPRSPWYYPAWQALAFISWAYVLDVLCGLTASRPWAGTIARVGGACAVVIQAILLSAVAWEMRSQQAVIEHGHRREIGLWLHAQAASLDRVYLEPLGYIGFFSNLKMLDNPGLSSPEVVAARRAGRRTHAKIIGALHPEWLVLRPDQVEEIRREAPQLFVSSYQLAKIFDVRKTVDAISFLPGRPYLDFDALYFVFRKSDTVNSTP